MKSKIDLSPEIYSNGMAEIELVRSLARKEVPGYALLPGTWLAISRDELLGNEKMLVTRCQLEEFGYELTEKAV